MCTTHPNSQCITCTLLISQLATHIIVGTRHKRYRVLSHDQFLYFYQAALGTHLRRYTGTRGREHSQSYDILSGAESYYVPYGSGTPVNAPLQQCIIPLLEVVIIELPYYHPRDTFT